MDTESPSPVSAEVEPAATPKNPLFARENLRQLLASLAVSLGGFTLGACLGWASPGTEDLVENNDNFTNLTDQQKSWIAAIVALGAFTSTPIAGFCIGKFGRRRTLMIFSPIAIASWLLLAFSVNLPMLLAARFLTGMCGGVVTLTSPIYIAEISSDALRGTMGSAFMVMIILGIICTYGVGGIAGYLWMSVFNAAFPALLLLFTFFIPESPIYLLTKGEIPEALKSLQWLRNRHTKDQIHQELQKMQNQVQENLSLNPSLRTLLSPQCLHPTLISMLLAFLNQLSGVQAVLSYATTIVESTNSGINPDLAAILLGLSVIAASALMDKAGRRILLIISELGMAVCFTAIGTFFYLKEQNGDVNPDNMAWLPIAGLILYICSYAIGVGPLPRIVLSEIIPIHVKAQAASVAFMFNWIVAFAVIKTFEDLTSTLKESGFFWFYAAICFLGSIAIYLFVPETKGRTFTEIEYMFQKKQVVFARSGKKPSSE